MHAKRRAVTAIALAMFAGTAVASSVSVSPDTYHDVSRPLTHVVTATSSAPSNSIDTYHDV